VSVRAKPPETAFGGRGADTMWARVTMYYIGSRFPREGAILGVVWRIEKLGESAAVYAAKGII